MNLVTGKIKNVKTIHFVIDLSRTPVTLMNFNIYMVRSI